MNPLLHLILAMVKIIHDQTFNESSHQRIESIQYNEKLHQVLRLESLICRG